MMERYGSRGMRGMGRRGFGGMDPYEMHDMMGGRFGGRGGGFGGHGGGFGGGMGRRYGGGSDSDEMDPDHMRMMMMMQ